MVDVRRQLAEAGLEVSVGKMSALWTGTPATVRLEDLDLICSVMDCEVSDMLIREPDVVAAHRPPKKATASKAATPVAPRLGRNRTKPPA